MTVYNRFGEEEATGTCNAEAGYKRQARAREQQMSDAYEAGCAGLKMPMFCKGDDELEQAYEFGAESGGHRSKQAKQAADKLFTAAGVPGHGYQSAGWQAFAIIFTMIALGFAIVIFTVAASV